MRRFYLSPEALKAPDPVVSGADANHIKNVLRLRPGQTIAVFDGLGNVYEAAIAAISSESVSLSLGRSLASENKADVEITLAQALLKSNKMDALVRQMTELGIARWTPFIAERSVPSPDDKRMEKKRTRWEAIAREALKQCRRNRLPEIGGLVAFEDVLRKAADCDLNLIFWEDETDPADLLSLCGKRPHLRNILILVGPEGGFTESEIHRAKAGGFQCVSLGPRILRAETAALTACALSQFLFGDLRQKSP